MRWTSVLLHLYDQIAAAAPPPTHTTTTQPKKRKKRREKKTPWTYFPNCGIVRIDRFKHTNTFIFLFCNTFGAWMHRYQNPGALLVHPEKLRAQINPQPHLTAQHSNIGGSKHNRHTANQRWMSVWYLSDQAAAPPQPIFSSRRTNFWPPGHRRHHHHAHTAG